jgi:hypothetical protein
MNPSDDPTGATTAQAAMPPGLHRLPIDDLASPWNPIGVR